jgi:dihydroorotate dehydrogenase (fumarate)
MKFDVQEDAMLDLSTKYMGLELKNPIIIGSAGLTDSTEKIKKLEANGAAAVVFKSIFEEQILMESNSIQSKPGLHTEELDYLRHYTRQHNLDEYLKLVTNTKKEVSIPVISSINCKSSSEWTEFAKKIQDAGVDALELNMFILPGNVETSGEEIEKIYFQVIEDVRKHVTIPISLKLSFYFSGMANMIFNLSVRKIDGIVLFNRFYRPDIDLETMELISADVFSTPQENTLPLRWIGLLSGEIKCDLAASTGIHDGETVIKNMLAGAKAVQVTTVVYQKGMQYINTMLDRIKKWMIAHNYTALRDIIGRLSYKHIEDPVKYERSQFMRYFSDIK